MPKAKSKEEKRGEKVKPKRLVILDAHAIIHRAYHALPEDFATSAGVPTGALYGLATMLIKIIGELKPDYMAAAYDLPKPTYRHAAYEDYKGKRAKTDDALVAQLKRSREIFEAFNIPVYDAEGFEADDVLGTIVQTLHATRSTLHCDVIIASGDMDTLQLVDGDRVRVYTLKKGIQDTILYNEEKVKERFGFGPEFLPDFKGLRGDPSDNIIGIPGIGEKTATELIQKFGHIEDIYDKLGKDKKAFEKEGVKARVVLLLEKHKEEAEFSKMLAVIRRDAPVLFKLPEKEWKESVDEKKAEEIFSRFEFRTMAARFREAVGGNKEVGIRNNELGIRNKEEEDLDKDELKETQIALWLINSSITSPKLEDIFSFAKTKDFAKARQAVFSELEKRNLKKVFEEIERPLIAVVRKMNKRGVKIDTEYLNKLSKEYHKELTKLEENIWKEAA
ncbi:MAG: 5'-3' exonuclease H3TH domain-containing protein, partial [bacterium]|nr:5'-3' exonuclease H3TH domain-containing protein [bacterium]